MMTKEMEDTKWILDHHFGGNFDLMIEVYERVLKSRKEAGDTKNIIVFEKELETLNDMKILTEKKDE